MQAVISLREARARVATLPLAGRPLLARQIQWLLGAGFDRIAVELDAHAESDAAASWLAVDPLGAMVRQVLTASPIDPADVVLRAGFDVKRPFLVLPADVLGDVDLTDAMRASPDDDVVMTLSPPTALKSKLRGATVRVARPHPVGTVAVRSEGWGAAIARLDDAMSLGALALSGTITGMLVHAAETSPGVWIARGASVSPEAKLRAPVYVGVDALVRAGAILGPNAQLGDRVVVERDATVREAWVSEGTTVGEGVAVERCAAIGGSIAPLDGDRAVALGDPLLLDAPAKSAVPWSDRAVAAMLLVALVPLTLLGALVAAARGRGYVRRIADARADRFAVLRRGASGVGILDLAPALVDVIEGHRTLLGVAPRVPSEKVSLNLRLAASAAPCGAIAVDHALCPADADEVTIARATAWYAHARTRRLDLSLLLLLLRRRDPGAIATAAQS
jgi:hypothetical protein